MTEQCSLNELQTRLATLESGLQALRDVLTERDLRYTQRASAQDTAVAAALATSKEAVTKAEVATEKRLEVLNELREVVVDQSRDFSRKSEVQLLIDGMEKRIEVLATLVSTREGHGGGVKEAIGWMVGAVGLGLAAISAFLHR